MRSRLEEIVSEVTDADDVSYVSSSYLPESLRHEGLPTTSNAKRAREAKLGVLTVEDEVDEVILLDEVSILICEWIPYGANAMVKLNDNMGSHERCQGGSMGQDEPEIDPETGEMPEIEGGDTEVRVLDFKEARFLNAEAFIHFPEEPGVIQIECFGIHAELDGNAHCLGRIRK